MYETDIPHRNGKDRNMKRSRIAVMAAAILTISLSGCQEKEAETIQPQYEDFSQVCVSSDKDAKDIYVVTKAHTSSYWKILCQGAQQAGKELNYNIYTGGTVYETDLNGQYELLEKAQAAGADAILIAPVNSNETYPILEEMKASKIPVILVDTISNNIDFDACFMTDNMQAGRIAAEDMLKKLKEAGNSENQPLQVGIQVASLTSQTIIERVAGFFEYWMEHAPEKWSIAEHIYCNEGSVSKAVELTEEMIQSCEYLGGLVGCNNGSTVGLSTALKESGRKDLVLVGFDFSDEIAELIHSEDYTASTVVQHQYEMGYQGVMAASAMFKNKYKDGRFVDTQVELIDSQNAEKYEASH